MMHYHGTLGRVICFLTILLLSIAGIIIGLLPFNIDILGHSFIQTNLHAFIKPLQVAVGIAGVIGLLYLLGLGFGKCDHHHMQPK